jgi:hypothetical protein
MKYLNYGSHAILVAEQFCIMNIQFYFLCYQVVLSKPNKMYESREAAVECDHPRCIPLHKHHILKKYVAVLEENLKYQRSPCLYLFNWMSLLSKTRFLGFPAFIHFVRLA